MKAKAQTEDRAAYRVTRKVPAAPVVDDDAVIAQALAILKSRLQHNGPVFDNPTDVKNYLTLQYGGLPHEEFGVLWLDVQHRLIKADTLFRGTLTQASIYPREVVKDALAANAAAVILCHNHPSGNTQPSNPDVRLTQLLKEALAYVEVEVIDHIIVSGGATPTSFAEIGLL